MSILITDVIARDIRFPTSRSLDGSDAMNTAPDYSAAYVVLTTNDPRGLEGHGLTFTTGRGTEVCVAAVNALKYLVKGKSLESFTENMGAFWHMITGDSHLRWLGPEKGVMHLATAAIVNAVWDLWAKTEGKPLWKLLVDMTPEQLVACIDFRYITDALTPGEALAILQRNAGTRAARIAEMERDGYPAYTTSTGWLGYSDEKVRRLCREALAEGWTHFKIKVGGSLEDDMRRSEIIREEIGPDRKLMMDANQVLGRGRGHREYEAPGRLQPLVDRGADQPRRHPGSRGGRQGRSAHRRRDRRACTEPDHLQAAFPGQRHQLLPDR